MEIIHSVIVEKENISILRFSGMDVLNSEFEQKKRLADLLAAVILGNVHRRKVKIIFETAEGTKQVETTIWAVTEKNVIFKGSIAIPIHCIYEVRAY